MADVKIINTIHSSKVNAKFFIIFLFYLSQTLWYKVAIVIKLFDNQNRRNNDQNYILLFRYSLGVCWVCALKNRIKWVGSSKPIVKAISEISLEV